METKSTKPSLKRRAILQGSLAAPVVLTVSSPVSAQTTTFGRCLAQQVNRQPTNIFASSEDNWYRKTVWVKKLRYQGVEDWYYLDPNRHLYFKLSTMQWMSFGSILPAGWTDTPLETGPRWALVWVDASSGSPLQIMQVDRPGGYTAATKSCMNSVKPGTVV